MSTGSITLRMLHGLERTLLPLSQAFPVSDFVDGMLCSIGRDGSVVPLSDALPFGGVLDGVGQERGRWLCSLLIRGTLSVPISGLAAETAIGCKIYAVRAEREEHFSLCEPGAVVGQLLDIESVEQAMGRVKIQVGAIEGSSANQ